MKQILFVLGFFLLSCLSVAAQGWQRAYADTTYSISNLLKVLPTNDGGYLSIGYVSNSLTQKTYTDWKGYLYLVRTNNKGELLSQKVYKDVVLNGFPSSLSIDLDIVATDSSRSFIIIGNSNNTEVVKGRSSGWALKIDEFGQKIWFKKYTEPNFNSNITKIMPLDNGNFMFIGKCDSGVYLLKINAFGDSISRIKNNFCQASYLWSNFDIQKDTITFLIDTVTSVQGILSNLIRLSVKIDTNGVVKEIHPFDSPATLSLKFFTLTDGTLLTVPRPTFFNSDGSRKVLVDFFPTTNLLYYSSLNSRPTQSTCLKTKDGNWIYIFSGQVATDSIWRLFLTKFDSEGHTLWKKVISSRAPNFADVLPLDIIQTNDGGFLVCGFNGGENTIQKAKFMYLDGEGNYYSNTFTGKIYNDINTNCQYNNEQKLKNWLVKAENTRNGDVYWGISDSLGIYNINVDTGSYTVKVMPPNANWQTCTPSVSRSFSQFHTADTLDFGIQPLINCPVLTADMSTPLLRRCMDNIYSVRYGNDGTVAAQNAYITVALDPLLRFKSASLPLSSRVGNLLRFNLGTIDINQSGRFSITTNVACGDSTRLGQTLCNTVHIYPDSVCLLPTDWSGASITVEGTCGHDSVRFTVRNRGVAPSQSLSSVVVEDQVLFATRRVQLSPNGAQVYAFPTNGSTWRMTVEQEPNHPTSRAPTAVVEGCGRNVHGGFSTGFVTLFDNDDGNPSEDIDCQQIIGSYDPNDKTGYPIGYDKDNHFINPNQDIEYFIRFQNTGTDTAFTVVVRDTLPPELDIASLELGASSHPYSAKMLGKNVLAFNFEKINLVDSFHNEVASHGFVKFRIKQKKDLPLGTRIENGAAIFFDFNAPVLTEKAWHTIGKSWLASVAIDKTGATDVKIKVFPNPLSDIATFDLENTPLSTEGQFSLYDATGRLVRSQKFKGRRFDFDRRDLPSGLFIFRIDSNGQLLGSGKLLVD